MDKIDPHVDTTKYAIVKENDERGEEEEETASQKDVLVKGTFPVSVWTAQRPTGNEGRRG